MTFISSYGAALLLDSYLTISEDSQMLFPLLAGLVAPSNETIYWIQFAYTADQTGAYLVPASTVLDQSAVLERDPLFPAIWRHLLHIYLGAYAPTTSKIGPL